MVVILWFWKINFSFIEHLMPASGTHKDKRFHGNSWTHEKQ
jgi:hypothetical protein